MFCWVIAAFLLWNNELAFFGQLYFFHRFNNGEADDAIYLHIDLWNGQCLVRENKKYRIFHLNTAEVKYRTDADSRSYFMAGNGSYFNGSSIHESHIEFPRGCFSDRGKVSAGIKNKIDG